MNAQLTALTRRRAALVAQSAAQRAELGRCVQPWQTPLAFVDRWIALARRVRAHPLALAIGVLLLFRSGSSRWSVWGGRFWTGWQIFQSLYNRPSRPRD
ncbi:MAG: YqjK family protein [Pseudomonadota bacterium]